MRKFFINAVLQTEPKNTLVPQSNLNILPIKGVGRLTARFYIDTNFITTTFFFK